MGAALLKGWLDGGVDPSSVKVIDPNPPPDSTALLADAGIAVHDAAPADITPAVVVVAIKPQMMQTVLPGLRPVMQPDTLVLSIAAGTSIARLAAGLGEAAIVRSMPNTPAQVGRGITAAVPNDRVDEAGRAMADRLLAAVGDVVWLDDEAQLDAVTAVSGSGPAYVFLLAECLAEAAVEAGLPPDLALQLARQTVTGASELLHRSELTPTDLRRNVTSPGGTTAAALSVLMADDGIAPLMIRAVAEATRRSRELDS